MNEIVTDLKNLEIETLKNLKNSKSSNTLRAYSSDYRDFSAFCTKNNFSALPTDPKVLALYLTHLSQTSKFSTLKRRIASISVVHKLKGHYIDTKHPLIIENLLGIKRKNGSHQKAKKPILINDLKEIIKVINEDKIRRFNKIYNSITIATLQNNCIVSKGEMIATIKIIPFSIMIKSIKTIEKINFKKSLYVETYKEKKCALLLTHFNKENIKLNDITKRTTLYLVIICSVSLLIRLFYFPFDIPLTHDAVGYFWYAIDTKVLEHLATDYGFPNTGWPMLLSLFFGIMDSNNFIDYMTIQRLVTIVISVLTIIPVYFLCKKFFNNSLSLLGALLFAFEPNMIQNSILGLTDILYIFLITTSFLLVQSSNKKLVYFAFAIASLSAIVRYEGLVFLAVLTIIFFIKDGSPDVFLVLTAYPNTPRRVGNMTKWEV